LQITKLTSTELLIGIKSLTAKERKITSLIIEHLEEIERRKLYCDLKYSSLFKYCVQELGYSEDQACRRINAMRVVKKMPEVKTEIDSGAVTLTTLNIFSSAANELELNKKEKSDLMDRFKGKSKRACQAEVDQLRAKKGKTVKPKPAAIRADQAGTTRVSVSLKDTVVSDLRSLAAEKKMSFEDLLSKLITNEKAKSTEKVSAPAKRTHAGKDIGKGRYIPKKVREIVRARADHQCENCGSNHQLQFEHKTPIAIGGKSSAENLALFCRNCNIRAGIKRFGLQKMKR
jgi:5-methylcytosine-specific restriction endonuclease McrA